LSGEERARCENLLGELNTCELACQRWRPDSRPVLADELDSTVGVAEGCDLLIWLVGAKLAREGGLTADLFWRMNWIHM
jgi:hypothetical protein